MARSLLGRAVAGAFSITMSLCVASPIPAQDKPPLLALQEAVVSLYEEHKDAVVRVKVAAKHTAEGEERVTLTVLSGFFIDAEGTVLTNAVPASETARVWIEKDGRQYLAEVLGTDKRTNISVLKTAKPPQGFDYIELDAGREIPAIGSLAFAITSPLDFAPTPKWGLVSGRESHFSDIEFPLSYTRISIPAGPAEGGSPVFGHSADLIGISVATLPEVSSSYLVPTRALQLIAGELKASGSFSHLRLPAELEERVLNSQEKHVSVKSVEPASPAGEDRLQIGDVLIQIDGYPAATVDQARDAIFFSKRGEALNVTVLRDGKKQELRLALVPATEE